MTSRRSRIQLRPNIRPVKDKPPDKVKEATKNCDHPIVPLVDTVLNDSNSNDQSEICTKQFTKTSSVLSQWENVCIRPEKKRLESLNDAITEVPDELSSLSAGGIESLKKDKAIFKYKCDDLVSNSEDPLKNLDNRGDSECMHPSKKSKIENGLTNFKNVQDKVPATNSDSKYKERNKEYKTQCLIVNATENFTELSNGDSLYVNEEQKCNTDVQQVSVPSACASSDNDANFGSSITLCQNASVLSEDAANCDSMNRMSYCSNKLNPDLKHTLNPKITAEETGNQACETNGQRFNVVNKPKLKIPISRFSAKKLPYLRKSGETKHLLNAQKKRIDINNSSSKCHSHDAVLPYSMSSPVPDLNKNTENPESPVAVKKKNNTKNDKEVCNKKKNNKQHNSDQCKMTMLDLIYWNNHAENSTQSTEKEKNVLKEKVTGKEYEISDKSMCSLRNETVTDRSAENRSSNENNALIPRVMIDINGEITIDENSLVVQKQVEEIGLVQSDAISEKGNKETTYSSFRRRTAVRAWSEKETAKFFKVLGMLGTDFSLMSRYFPNRTRRALKLKFKREEKRNFTLVDTTLRNPAVLDFTLIESYAEDEMDEELKERTSDSKKKFNKKKQISKANIEDIEDNSENSLGEEEQKKQSDAKPCNARNSEKQCSAQAVKLHSLSQSLETAIDCLLESPPVSSSQEAEHNENTENNIISQKLPSALNIGCNIDETNENICCIADVESDVYNLSTHEFRKIETTSGNKSSNFTLLLNENNRGIKKIACGIELVNLSSGTKSDNLKNKVIILCIGFKPNDDSKIKSWVGNLQSQT